MTIVAASAPTFATGPIVGALADKYGAEFIIMPSLLAAVPWLPLMILKGSLPAFIVFFSFASKSKAKPCTQRVTPSQMSC